MALNFPTNPTIGDSYSVGSITWVWNGTAWKKFNPISVSTATVSSNTFTGAVTINGGLGINGSINAQGPSTIDGATIVTTATIAGVTTLQLVTDAGASTTNIVSFTNTSNSTSTVTGSIIVSGGVGVAKDLVAGGTVQAEHLRIQDAVIDSSYVTTDTTATIVIDQYPTNIYRSSKYLIQVEEDMGLTSEFQIIEILLLVTNDFTVLTTDYGLITSNGELGEFSSDVDQVDPSNPLLKLYFTPYAATNKVITVCRTAVTR